MTASPEKAVSLAASRFRFGFASAAIRLIYFWSGKTETLDTRRISSSMIRAHFILYVNDQDRSTAFYREVLALEPVLQVPGMSEFTLPGNSVLGLMPISGITRLLSDAIPDIASQPTVPRAELYLVVDDATPYVSRAIAAGARQVSPVQARDWGDIAGYYQDPDGHVIAFAVSGQSA